MVLVCGAAGGCGAIGFDVEQEIPLSMVPGDPNGAFAAVDGQTPLQINIDAEAEKQGGLAHSAHLKSLTFTVTSPRGGTFYFVTGVTISIAAVAAGLKEIRIARLENVPATNTISIPPLPNIEILPYARAGASIRAIAIGKYPREDTSYVGKVVIHVNI